MTTTDPTEHVNPEHVASGRWHIHPGLNDEPDQAHCHSIRPTYQKHKHNGGMGYSLKHDEQENSE